MPHRYDRRRKSLLSNLPDGMYTVFLTPGETLRYFTGLDMYESERPTVLALHRDQEPVAILPALETGRIREALGASTTFFVYEDATNPGDAAKTAFEDYAAEFGTDSPVGVEYRSTRLLEQEVIATMAPKDRIVDVEPSITRVRERKDEREIDALRTAASIIDDVPADVTERIRPEMTERDVAHALHKRVLDTKADGLGVLIVASGPNTAKSDTNTGQREIQDGDALLIDAGVTYQGYYSDTTRTYMIGSDSERIRELHECTREAARAARYRVEPGRELQSIDRTARTVIEEAGYGEYFPHRVGHGLGIEGHEPPYLVEGNDAPLEVGHAITVEPGIYIEGVGAVRVEDDVVVTDDGAEVLTTTPRELRVI